MFNMSIVSEIRGRWYNIFKGMPSLGVRKHSFLFFRVTDPWTRLPNKVVEAPIIEAFERWLDTYWRGHPQLYDFWAPSTYICAPKKVLLPRNKLALEA